ncbi:unnamed protein product [Schistosoma turkestanicum]|nr:unnamed protein product [Schistosoma turkestanicum]
MHCKMAMSAGSLNTVTRPIPKPSDFKFGKEIGQGTFSTVYVVQEISTSSEFAMKVVDKQRVWRYKAVDSVLMEKEKILSLSYTFAPNFDPVAKDLVEQLLVISPNERLGSPTHGGSISVRQHMFFSGIKWDTLPYQEPPLLVPNLEPIAPEGWDNLPVGFKEAEKYHLSRELELSASQITEDDRIRLLSAQAKHNPFNCFVRGRLILKQGILFKRRGLFARRRMFLLTEGPHLFYVDVENMTLKGEVAWSNSLAVELRSVKLFFIHVPNKTYYLEDPSGHADDWVKQITSVKARYFSNTQTLGSDTPSTSTHLGL